MTPTPPAADVVASALASTWALLATTLRTVWATRPDTSADDMQAGLEAVAATGLPHCLEARPACRAVAGPVAERHGLVADPDIPLMATAAGVEPPRVPV